ncbi:MAG: hypothetical protein V7K82_23085 [Nostoc sp.]
MRCKLFFQSLAEAQPVVDIASSVEQCLILPREFPLESWMQDKSQWEISSLDDLQMRKKPLAHSSPI